MNKQYCNRCCYTKRRLTHKETDRVLFIIMTISVALVFISIVILQDTFQPKDIIPMILNMWALIVVFYSIVVKKSDDGDRREVYRISGCKNEKQLTKRLQNKLDELSKEKMTIDSVHIELAQGKTNNEKVVFIIYH